MAKNFITIEHVSAYTGFDGNIDDDSLNPFVFMAQTEIKRILGDELYTKMWNDFQNDTPFTGDYLKIYESFIMPIESYFTASFYLQLGIAKVSQNGAYLVTPEKTEQIFDEKTSKMANKYEALAIGLEHTLVDFLNTLTIPEWVSPDQTSAKSSFNWIKVK